MKVHRILALTMVALLATAAIADDSLLGGKKGGGKGGGGSSGGSKSGGSGGSKSDGGSKSGGSTSGGRVSDRDSGGPSPRGGGSTTSSQGGSSRGDSDLMGGRGRTGPARYGSNSNGNSATRSSDGRNSDRDLNRYRDFESVDENEASRRARRENRTEPNYRSGYYHYDSRWNDNSFCYPYYSFDYRDECDVSPWYPYPHLPGYVSNVRISVRLPQWRFTYEDEECDFEYEDRYDRDDRDYGLYSTTRDLVRIFERRDLRLLNSLIPRRGVVVIKADGRRGYAISTEDFYDLMYDNIYSTKTRRYEIVRMTRGWGGAKVVARHEFEDPWRRKISVYHQYILEEAGWDRYNIVEFGTYRSNPNGW